jgi:hypothetical protein
MPYKKLFSQALPGILQGIILCMLLLQVGAFLVGWHSALSSPLDLDYAERWHAYVASQAFLGGNHVTSAYEMPYNTLPYPPVSYLLHGWIGKLIGADLLGIRTIGRTTALTATLLSTCLIVLISRTVGVRLVCSLVAGLLFLTSQSAHMFSVSLRPDEMACATMLLGLYTIVRLQNYWLTGIIFALALATKHSFITVPLVITVSLLLKRDLRSVVKLATSGCLTGLVIATLGHWMLGSYWWQGQLLQGFHGANLKQMLFFVGEGFKQPVLVIGLACLVLVDFSGPIATVAAGFAASLFLNVAMLVKVGAAPNYFLEPVALAAILIAYVVERFLGEQPLFSKGAAWALVLALLIPSTVTTTIEATHLLKDPAGSTNTLTSLVALVSSVNEPILADTSGIYFDSHHKPFASPPDLIMAATEASKINDQPMLQFINQKGFKMVVVRKNWKEFRHFPQTWIEAIEKNYQNLGVIDGFQIFRPKT